jgi:hypothetical protein
MVINVFDENVEKRIEKKNKKNNDLSSRNILCYLFYGEIG